ncbi:MAG: glutamyl-tRNA reductase [Francisellaceae bacterium]|mgnify:FL=1|nr:glutamyl-tRNA reductase [Francisellaceae bacterium]MBT6537934.1 glutamyl-tRNA reductase [Francisellaceae bacterium]
MNIWSIGLNHHSAPIEIREKMTFNQERLPEIVKEISSFSSVSETVILSTCNRTEIYCIAKDLFPIGKKVISEYFDVDEVRAYTYTYANFEAVNHLMRVGCGLDSMVVGESQILGQLKLAYKISVENQGVGRLLGRMFQRAFAVAKLVRMNTEIGLRPVSVASVVAKLAKQLFSNLSESTILILGAGDTAMQLLTHLKGLDVGTIIIANRSVHKAIALADKLGITAKTRCFSIEKVAGLLHEADIVLGATSALNTIIDEAMVIAALKQRKYKSMCFFDIAVPRDISAKVAHLENAFLYSVDDLKNIIAKNKQIRQDACFHGEKIIEEEVTKYMRWFYAQEHSNLIAEFRTKFEIKKKDIVKRAHNQLQHGARAKDVIEKLAHSISQEFLHVPTLAIKDANESGNQNFMESIENLFNIKR